MKKILLVLLSICLWGCDSDDSDGSSGMCGESASIQMDGFFDIPSAAFEIESASVSGDCLLVSISSSGCDGESWEVDLIDQGNLIYTNPPQRILRLTLSTTEVCEAYLTRDYSFDLSSLQVISDGVYLNLVDYDEMLFYEY